MGHYLDLHDYRLQWKEGVDLDNVLEQVKGVISQNPDDYALSISHVDEALECEDIYELMMFFFEEVWVDDRSKDYIHVRTYDTLGDEDTLLAALAPYLRDGCYLRYRGSDGGLFGWEIRDGGVVSQHATLTWVDDHDQH